VEVWGGRRRARPLAADGANGTAQRPAFAGVTLRS
jgi:hypothetical protein